MERTALQKLADWDSNKRKKPLIVWGARQVGKTYLILELFAKKYYPNRYIYVDCKKEDEIRDFCSGTANAEKIIEYISLRKGQQLNEQTLLIFDEVQECPNILSSLNKCMTILIIAQSLFYAKHDPSLFPVPLPLLSLPALFLKNFPSINYAKFLSHPV